MNEQQAEIAVLVPVIVALVETAKRAGLPNRWCGLAAVGLGLAAGVLEYLLGGSGDLARLGSRGLLAGLAASGLYSTGKNAAGR